MELDKISNRIWSIFACSAKQNKGIKEGMQWFIETISKNK